MYLNQVIEPSGVPLSVSDSWRAPSDSVTFLLYHLSLCPCFSSSQTLSVSSVSPFDYLFSVILSICLTQLCLPFFLYQSLWLPSHLPFCFIISYLSVALLFLSLVLYSPTVLSLSFLLQLSVRINDYLKRGLEHILYGLSITS